MTMVNLFPLSRNLEDSPLSLNNCQESHAAPFKKVFIQRILLPMFGLVCIALPNFVAFKVKSTKTLSSYTTLQPIIHSNSNTTYGHIHMAKSSDIHKVCSDIGVTAEMVAKSRVYGNPSKFSYTMLMLIVF